MTDRYAVVGNPVAHSRSPQIHAEFARQTGQVLHYEKLLAPLDAFEATVFKFRAADGKGVNVTLPFKPEAYRLAGIRSERAEQARAVNTLTFDGERIYGDNSDGVGLVRDIEANLGFSISGKRVLLMGAGGASQGVMHPLLSSGPELLVVANRTLEKANRLVAHFQQLKALATRELSAKPYQQLAGSQFDLVINATSAGLNDEMPLLPAGIFAAGSLAYDMVYGKRTLFMDFARAHGAQRISEGIGMLVEQAAESFYLWRGVRPDTEPVIAMLKREGRAC